MIALHAFEDGRDQAGRLAAEEPEPQCLVSPHAESEPLHAESRAQLGYALDDARQRLEALRMREEGG